MKIPGRIALGLLCLLLSVPALQAQEQSQFSLALGGAYNLPLGVFSETDGAIYSCPETGFATDGSTWQVKGYFHMSDKLALYGYYAKPRFNVDNAAVEAQLLEQGNPWSYEAEYNLTVIGFGARLTPLRIAMVAPYVQAGLAQYTTEIVQRVADTEEIMKSDGANAVNFGAGVQAWIGPVGVDLGAVYHSAPLVIEGHEWDYETSWLEIGLSLFYTFGG